MCCSCLKEESSQPRSPPLLQKRGRGKAVEELESSPALESDQCVKAVPGLPSRKLEQQLWAKGFKQVAGEICALCNKPATPCALLSS